MHAFFFSLFPIIRPNEVPKHFTFLLSDPGRGYSGSDRTHSSGGSLTQQDHTAETQSAFMERVTFSKSPLEELSFPPKRQLIIKSSTFFSELLINLPWCIKRDKK